MEHKVSVEVSEDDRPDDLVKKNLQVPLTLDSYIVPVVFDKAAEREQDEGINHLASYLCLSGSIYRKTLMPSTEFIRQF